MAESNRTFNITNNNHNVVIGNSRKYMSNFFNVFGAGFVCILIGMALIRISSGGTSLTLDSFFNFLTTHFTKVAGIVRNLNIPSLSISTGVPVIFAPAVAVWNSLVSITSVLSYLIAVIFDIFYTMVSILIWITTGYLL